MAIFDDQYNIKDGSDGFNEVSAFLVREASSVGHTRLNTPVKTRMTARQVSGNSIDYESQSSVGCYTI